MKFRQRLLFSLAFPLAVVVALGGAAAVGVTAFEGGLARYLAHEDALAQAAAEMYAQGLQTGQAIRNILLEPANPKAYENRKAAVADFERARTAAIAAASTPEQKALLERIVTLREKHRVIQDEVEAMVRADPRETAAAAARLRSAETPAWRALKDELLKLRAQAGADMKATREGAVASMGQARLVVLGLVALCVVACVTLAIGLVRYLQREIGGEPSLARAALARIEAGDLATPVPVRPGDAGSVMAALAHMKERLGGLVTRVRGTSHEVSGASDRIAEGNGELAQRTESQASALEQTSATMEQLTATVRQNASSAVDAARIAREASATAHRGGEVVTRVVDSVRGMTDNANRIRQILGVIDDIAFQTNLLALNASVEAARAGEQGRGFAVVAGEVRLLAGRSAEAAREIKDLITASVERSEEGARLADEANVAMEQVVGSIKRVAQQVAEISTASAEQSAGVAQMGQAVQQLDEATQRNATLVETSAAATESLRRQAHELEEAITIFRTA